MALGLDVGTKTIGVARTDALGFMAHPVLTVARKGVNKDVEKMLPLIELHGIEVLVVGLPYELDGSEARSAKLARQVGDALSARSGLPVHYVDERYSSVEAERRLIESGAPRKKRKAIIDQIAAVIILETWQAMERG